jgi:hypothetical protein
LSFTVYAAPGSTANPNSAVQPNSSGQCPSGYITVNVNGSIQCVVAGVSGLGYANRMPASFVNAGRPIIPGQGMTAPVGYMNPGSVNRFPVQVFHRNS